MFLAKITLLSTKQGGRMNPPHTGPDRSQAYGPELEVNQYFTTCFLLTTESLVLDFNKEHLVMLDLLFPELYEQFLYEGMKLRFLEGSKSVGTGEILPSISE
jgi:hypothetical protein